MESKKLTISLDDPVFAGRLRQYQDAEEPAVNQPAATKKAVSPIDFYFDDIDQAKLNNSPKFKQNRRYRFVSNSLVVLAILLLCFGAYVAISSIRINKVIQGAHASAQAEPAEEQQPTSDDINSYTVAPTMPRFIKIDKFNVKARVKPLGVNSSNQLLAPSNVFDAGWYKDSAVPGSSGTSLIDGHVSGTTQHGVFWDLRNIAVGDTVTIQRGDGKLLNYTVLAKETFAADKVDMVKALSAKNPGRTSLNLMTCTGQVHGHSYDQRLVVYTQLI